MEALDSKILATLKGESNGAAQPRTVELKGLLTETAKENVMVSIVPFNERNNSHVEFAYSYLDLISGSKATTLRDTNQAAREYVRIFLARTEADVKNEKSQYNMILRDLRSCRVLFFDTNAQDELYDFFDPA